MTDLVSIVVPCYRQARYLRECVDSLRAQSHQAWEAIIVDDGSPDDASEVAQAIVAMEPRVQYVRQANAGPSAARNHGLRLARGEYIQFLDADDLLVPSKLARHVGMLIRNPGLDLVYGNAWYFRDGEPAVRVRSGFGSDPNEDWIAAGAVGPEPMLHRLIRRNTIPICTPLFRRSLLERAGPMDESIRALEDWEFWIRCAHVGGTFAFDPAPEGESLIRLHKTSATQDREMMNGARFGLGLASLRYLDGPTARRLALVRLGNCLAETSANRRGPTYDALRSHVRGWEEVAAYWIARSAGPGSRLHPLCRPLLRRLPWRLQVLLDSPGKRQ